MRKPNQQKPEANDNPTKATVRIWLDADVTEYFKSLDEYEATINAILREHVAAKRATR